MTDLASPSSQVQITQSGFEIVPDEPLPRAVRRMTLRVLDDAVDHLRPSHGDDLDERIHGARKRMKRLRGLIRLVRDEVGYFAYRQENVVLRNTARTISGARDAWVHVETLRELRAGYEDLLHEETFAKAERWLLRRHQAEMDAVAGDPIFGAIVNLGAARYRFDNFPVEEAIADDYSAIAGGLRRVYKRGRKKFKHSTDSRSVEDLHEWRKRAKYLRYQMEALEPLQPRLIGSLADELNELGDLLGDDHDLAELAQTIADNPQSVRDERERWLLVALAYERRQDLQQRALQLGTALYSERPKDFVDRMGAYWEAGRR